MSQYATTPQVVALSASTTKTVVQYTAPSTHSVRLKKFSISFDGIDATKIPIRVDLLRSTTAGTATGGTLVKLNGNDESATGTTQYNFSAEPTAGDILDSWYVTPAGGLWTIQYPLGDEIILPVSTRIGLRCVVPSGTSCNSVSSLTVEE